MDLSPEEIESLAEALCVRSHDGAIRPMLFERIPPKLWGRVPIHRAVIDQYRVDLQTLRGATVNGDEPAVAVYLENAARLLVPEPVADVCRALALRVRRGPTWVVLFSPRGSTGWREAHPGARCIAADAPSGRWHRRILPGREAWASAHAEVERIVERLRGRTGRVVVYASMPYSLAAVLGNALLDLPGLRCRFCQAEGPPDAIRWVDYGPADGVHAGPEQILAPIARAPGRSDHIALTCGITWRPDIGEVEHGLAVADAAGATRIDIGPAAPGHSALPDLRSIERAVRDLEAAIDRQVRRPGVEALHVFFNGPSAVLQRAAGKLHQPRPRIVFHERGVDGTYWPAVSFEGGAARLLTPALSIERSVEIGVPVTRRAGAHS